jgi:hypothetical protein
VCNNQVVPEAKQESKNNTKNSESTPKLYKGDINPYPNKLKVIDNTNPTQKGVHIIQLNNLPKKFGLSFSQKFLKPEKIDPNTIIFEIL